jgi:hypothetical protein
MLYIDDQDCVGACHLKNYSFVITYLLEDEHELSLGMLIRLKRIYNFFMLHACFYTICLVFHYTSWRFYAFFGTNLLTRCHSASFMFSAIFVFQKSYTGNILGIGQNKNRTSRNLPKLPEVQRGDEERPRAGHTTGRRGPAPGRAPYVCDRPGPLLTLPLRL